MNPSILAGVAIKSTAIFAAAWLVALALWRSSAAARHLVWTAAAAAVLALPLLSLALPSWRIAAVNRILSTDTGVVFRVFATGHAPAAGAPSVPAAVTLSPGSSRGNTNWTAAIPVLWAIGTAAMLFQMLLAYLALWRRRSTAQPFPAGTGDALAKTLGISQPVPVLQAAPGSMPMNFGLLRSVVFLPAGAASWTEERLRVVLLHELAHVRRGDVATHLLGRAALALHWWNPMAWIAWREFLKERERATDDLVLAAGARASEYAGHLLEVARTFHSAPATAWAAVAMARQSQLEGRLLSILDSGVRRGAVRRLAPLVAALAAVAVVAPFAALEAQEKPKPILPPEIDATILAANSQKNHELLDQAASAYIFLQKYEVAQTLLEDALKIRGEVSGQRSGPYAAGLVKLADLLEKRQQTDQAVDLYNRAVAIGDLPEVAPALYRLGIFKYRENPAAARDLFEHAVRLNPKGPSAGPATTWLAVLRASDAGGAGDAETLFQQALRLEDPNSLDAANTLNLYARFLTLQNRQSEAEPLLAQAAAITKTRFAGFPTDLPTFRAITRGPGGDVMPPQQAQASSALKVGNGVTAPRLLYKFEPEYTEEARAAKWQGTVLLFIEVTPDGIAENIRVLRSAGLGLDEKAVEAVKRWKFAPGAKEGVPVTVQAQIEVNFRLQ